MSTHHDEAAVREQAYLLWEKDGKPHGRDHEYWTRAQVSVADKAQMDTLTKPAPKKAKAEPAPTSTAKASGKAKAAPKLRAAASKSKPAPTKSAKPKKK